MCINELFYGWNFVILVFLLLYCHHYRFFGIFFGIGMMKTWLLVVGHTPLLNIPYGVKEND